MPGLRPGAPAGQPQQLIVDPSFPAGQPPLCLMTLQWLRRVFELIDHKHLSPGRFPLAVLSTLAAKLSSGNPELATAAGRIGCPMPPWPAELVDDPEHLLRWWVTRLGGYIHPALSLQKSSTHSGQGWFATEDLALSVVSSQPLMAIPCRVQLHVKDAHAASNDHMAWMEGVSAGGCEHEIFLALALAYERSQGEASAFYPYVRLLGEPTGLIFKSKADVSQALKDWGWSGERAIKLIRMITHNREVFKGLMAVAERSPLYPLLGSPSAADMQWAYSHVLARRFRQFPGDEHLKPAIDALRHDADANGFIIMQPTPTSPAEVEPSHPETFSMVVSFRFGVPHALAKGEELCMAFRPAHNEDLIVFYTAANGYPYLPSTIDTGKEHPLEALEGYLPGTINVHKYRLPPVQEAMLVADLNRMMLEQPHHPMVYRVLRPLQRYQARKAQEQMMEREKEAGASLGKCIAKLMESIPSQPGAAKREKVVATVRQAIMLPDLTGWERQSLREMLETHLQGTPAPAVDRDPLELLVEFRQLWRSHPAQMRKACSNARALINRIGLRCLQYGATVEDASLLAVEAAWQRGLLGPIKSYHVPTMATILADIQRANGVADGMSADQVVDVSGSAASGGEGTDGTKPDGAGVAQPAEEAPIN